MSRRRWLDAEALRVCAIHKVLQSVKLAFVKFNTKPSGREIFQIAETYFAIYLLIVLNATVQIQSDGAWSV